MNNKKYNLKKLIEKYNKALSERYGTNYKLLEDIYGDLDAITSVQAEAISDSCELYVECEIIKKYLYFKYIEKDIKDLEMVVL
jgi:hypothetical protein